MKLRYLSLLCGLGLVWVPSCGASNHLAARGSGGAAEGGDGAVGDAASGTVNQAGGSASSEAGATAGGEAGGAGAPSLPGAGGQAGAGIGGVGSEAGASGVAGSPEAGAGGAGGAGNVDTSGTPEGVVSVTGTRNLSSEPLATGRTCAEAPQYSITALGAKSATLAEVPADGCLAVGDEVLLINLQGTSAAHDTTGNWELVRIASVSGTTVAFTTAKTKTFGASSGSDDGIGTAVDTQRVALVRVPHFTSLSVEEGAELSAAPWNGSTGGVVAVRADLLKVDGSISAASLGYRSGRWSRDDFDCSDNLTTEAGESISGVGAATTARNVGASGGILAFTATSYNANSPANGSAGHALPGEVGFNANGRTLGEPGAAYGVGDGSKLTMGSGPGGVLTCDSDAGREPYLVAFDVRAGGIVLLLVGELQVGATGTITAQPLDPSRDLAPSGGYIYVRGTKLSVGDGRLTARGALGRSVNGPTQGQANHGSPGYIVLEGATVSGTTDPVANVASP